MISIKLCWLAVAAALPFSVLAQVTKDQIKARHQSSTIYIEVEYENNFQHAGTGFVVNDTGHVLTAAHVLSKCGDCEGAKFWGRVGAHDSLPRHELRIVEPDSNFDMALLQFKDSVSSATKVHMRAGKPASSTVFALGFPISDPYSASTGEILTDRLGGGEWRVNVAIGPGSSGGPVFDTTGVVVAMAIGGVVGERGFKTVLPIIQARDLLKKIGLVLAEPDQRGAITVFVDLDHIAGTDQSAIALVKSKFGDLRAKLTKLSFVSTRAEAKYSLTSLRVFEEDNSLSLRGEFEGPGVAKSEFVGKCAECDGFRQASNYAVADVLHQTVLNSKRGPYKAIRITKCQPHSDSNRFALNLKTEGAGFEKALYFELGEQIGQGEVSYTGAFIDYEDELESSDPSIDLRALFKKPPGTLRAPKSCAQDPLPTSDVLVMRMMRRPVSNSTRVADPRSLQ